MSKIAPWVFLLGLSCLLMAISVHHSHLLSDEGNPFLRDFLDNDILSILGFMTAVGSAASMTILIKLNDLEDDTEARFMRVKKSLKASSVSLIFVFLVCFVALIFKPIVAKDQVGQALFNSVGIGCVFFCFSVLRDLTLTVFGTPTKRMISEQVIKNRKH